MPVLLAGGGGVIPLGRHLMLKDARMSDLFITLLQRFGMSDVTTFGDDGSKALAL